MESPLDWAEFILALLAIAALAKSGYNGMIHQYVVVRLRKAEEAHERMEDVERKLDDIQERQEQQTDVLIAIGQAANGDKEFDVDRYSRVTGRDSVDQFFTDR